MAAAIWREAVTLAGTAAAAYLHGRNLDLPARAEDAPRFHLACPRGPERPPAMLALMTSAAGNGPVGVHRTFPRANGGGKAPPGPHGEGAKMMPGGAGVIRLVNDADVTGGPGIAGGSEPHAR